VITEKDCYNYLEKLGIAYEKLTHEPVFTIEEAEAELPGRTEVKNLFIQDDKGKRQYLVLMPGHKQLDLKTLAGDLGEKKMRFVSAPKMQAMLGVEPGSVSLFCCLNESSNHVEIVIDKELLDLPEIGFHPITNAATVFMEPSSFLRVIDNMQQQHRLAKL